MKLQPLELVIEHYRRLRDDAVAAQARVQLELAAAQRTLHTLVQHRHEQHQRARGTQHGPVSITQLLLQTRFSGKLEEAITLQRQRIADCQQRIERCRTRVLADQQRFKAIGSIEDQRAARARHKAARADQSATDERAANAHAQGIREGLDEQARQPLQPN